MNTTITSCLLARRYKTAVVRQLTLVELVIDMFFALVAILAFFKTSFCLQIQSSCNVQFNHRNCKRLPEVSECGLVGHSPRIVGGHDSALGQFPWMVLLATTDTCRTSTFTRSCGGTIITRTHVLTAAHCLPGPKCKCKCEISHVRVGEHDKRSRIDCSSDGTCAPEAKDIPVRDYVIHNGFDMNNGQNDIGLVRLASSIDFNMYVAPICLPMARKFQSDTFFGRDATFDVAGWGMYDSNHNRDSEVLQTVTLPHVLNSRCQLFYPVPITKSMLCAGGDNGQNVCRGDSGGPLMGVNSDQSPLRYFQFGISSQGPTNCSLPGPSTYTRVTAYLRWILDNLDG